MKTVPCRQGGKDDLRLEVTSNQVIVACSWCRKQDRRLYRHLREEGIKHRKGKQNLHQGGGRWYYYICQGSWKGAKNGKIGRVKKRSWKKIEALTKADSFWRKLVILAGRDEVPCHADV